jgi:hypothetical protein
MRYFPGVDPIAVRASYGRSAVVAPARDRPAQLAPIERLTLQSPIVRRDHEPSIIDAVNSKLGRPALGYVREFQISFRQALPLTVNRAGPPPL